MPITRRNLLSGGAVAASALAQTPARPAPPASPAEPTVSLCGLWQFRLDPEARGEAQGWQAPGAPADGWTDVTVPHTWNIDAATAEHTGHGWYRRSIDAPASWAGKTVRIEFEAAYHTATVWVNGKRAGEHVGKGYTAFTFDITALVKPGAENLVAVRVDNTFREDMLPRGRSYDWTMDGGLYRPVQLLITPSLYVENAAIEAVPDLKGSATVDVTVILRNAGPAPVTARVGYAAIEEATGRPALRQAGAPVTVPANGVKEVKLPAAKLERARLWHFDDPQLYTLRVTAGQHVFSTTFGIRTFEVKEGGFWLNGERIRPAGVERMAGSNPDFGMAEPTGWIDHDHRDMQELNCVFTRVHWPQDRRVLDYCDRHGILIQTEVPTWGGDTFSGMKGEPTPQLMNNGLEQLREMIARDRNHPSIFAWGLCNEVNGQNPPAQAFVRRMAVEARKLDPRRPLTYASHSLRVTPEKDVAGELDFISWNEYYGSWSPGGPDDVRDNLERIEKAFPGKPIVVSEYGYCACTAERPENDARRIEILKQHNQVFRERASVAALIFFCYNDYRTHVGDKGLGVLRQRVHGVVDLYGNRKTSFAELASEASPIEALEVVPQGRGAASLRIRGRKTAPAYRMSGYTVRALVLGHGEIPVEQHEQKLTLEAGEDRTVALEWKTPQPNRILIEVRRPAGTVVAGITYVPA